MERKMNTDNDDSDDFDSVAKRGLVEDVEQSIRGMMAYQEIL